jgi:phenylalanyl-tRNA synthetase beta chain
MLDDYARREPLRSIDVHPAQIDGLLGMHFDREQITRTLDDLGFHPVEGADGAVRVTVPGWRRFDVDGPADLAEEVGRIAGFNLVPSVMPTGALPEPRKDGDAGYADELRARRVLAAAGLQEVITYSLVDPDLVTLLAVGPDDETQPQLRIANPQSVELSVLRSSLLGSLLIAMRSNLRQRNRVLLFELARTWHGTLDPAPQERRHIGIAMVGPRHARHWSTSDGQLDFFDVKGSVQRLCDAFRVEVTYAPGHDNRLHPGRTAEVCSAGKRLGIIGQLHPIVAEQMDLGLAPVSVAELDFEELLRARQPFAGVRTPSRFPPADRDISFFVDESTPDAEIEAVIRDAAGDLLESLQLFDVFHGGGVPAGRQSLAYSLRYRASDKTLADDEVSRVHTRVEQALQTRFSADVRGRT